VRFVPERLSRAVEDAQGALNVILPSSSESDGAVAAAIVTPYST